MNANELRLGNFVTDEFYESFKTIIKVESINDKGINLMIEDDGNYPECAATWIEPCKRIDTLRPIPLTEEWLLKFGFDKEGFKQYEWLNYGMFAVKGLSDDYVLFQGFFKKDSELTSVKYVHQLQNLYFCLCGKELEFIQ